MPTPLDVLAAALAKAQAEYDAAKAAIAAQVAAPAADASPTDVLGSIVHQAFDLGIAAANAVQNARKPTVTASTAATPEERMKAAQAAAITDAAKASEAK